ncbi:MAG TPA: hypothetical protein VHP11_07160 [Tepidisphaeraceae bacterium]|nr:hypothetical protein [Tepidisphaeraceae bacterium]
MTISIVPDEDQYIAHATPIDLMGRGPTPQAARSALNDAVSVYIRTATEAGTLDQILQNAGYVLQNGRWIIGKSITSESALQVA